MRPILNIELNKLRERITIRPAGYGAYRISITIRGKEYTCISHNTLAVDATRYGRNEYYNSELAGYKALYQECKNKNYL